MQEQHAHFTPPFCPSRRCERHRDPANWRWKRAGWYLAGRPVRRVQRYACLDCGVKFSRQSYATTYWLKRPDIQPLVFLRLLSCSGIRQVARELEVAPSTVQRQASRLGRHALLFERHHGPRGAPDEPLVLDGFETFEFSQYHPVHFHVLAGSVKHYFYGFTDSELRRKGRMTSRQAARRDRLEELFGRPDPGSVRKEVRRLLEMVLPRGSSATLHTDQHPAYTRAVASLVERRVEHETTPGRAARTPANPLSPINLLDLLIRHGSANHKRETIAFSKRRQGAAERLAMFQVWRNFMKHRSEQAKDATPAQRMGLAKKLLKIGDVLRERLFPARERLPSRLQAYYDRTIQTRQIPDGTTHDLRFAY